MNERHSSLAKSAMPPAYCDNAPELATMAELIAVADRTLSEALGSLHMIADDLSPTMPAGVGAGEKSACLTLFDRVKLVSEKAGYVAETVAAIRRRLGKAE